MSRSTENTPSKLNISPFSPRKPASAPSGPPLVSKEHRSENELQRRKPLNYLNQNTSAFRRSKSENLILISKKLNFSDLDDIPEEGKEKEVADKKKVDIEAKVKHDVPKTDDKTRRASPLPFAFAATTAEKPKTARTSGGVIATGGVDKMEPIAEEITDLLSKPLAISVSPTAVTIISNPAAAAAAAAEDSPTTSSLARSVRALSVQTPLLPPPAPDNQQAEQAPDSIKRPADPAWTTGSSPTSSRPRPSKRQKKAVSCDVLMQDVENQPPVKGRLNAGVLISRSQLHKSQSDPEAILRAIQQSDSDPLLIGDSSKRYALPILMTGSKHTDLKEISPETMLAVLKGEYASKLGSYQIIDCRYPYEFEGGHIVGALNLYTQRQVHEKFLASLMEETPTDSGSERHILIFHCEFSSQRAPNMCRFVRDIDRTLNKDNYPALHYPELYILHGGYKLFFERQPAHCTPSAYQPMADEAHTQELSYYKNKTKEQLIKASVGGSRTAQASLVPSSKERKTKSFGRLNF